MRRSRITVAAALALGLALPAGIAREVSAEPVLLSGAVLEWSVNDESNTGAFNGQCNFMSGGISDGMSPTYRATDGDATVLKRNAAGADVPVSDYSTRCKDANGTTVTAGGSARLGQKVVYANGTGTMDPATGQVDLRWTGTFSINFYGQLTPFWFTDPHLELDADGNGRITATIGGYSSSIDNPEVRELIEPIPGVEIATLRGVASDNTNGFVVTPQYLGVQVEGADSPQIRAFPGWGSWPVSYVRAMERLGMGSYWYTSGGAADARKPPAPLTVAYGTGVAPTTTTTAPTTTQPGGSTTTTAPTATSPPASTTTVPTVGGSNGVPIRAVVPDGP
ncbi:MAG: hypothetical protein ACK4V6_03835, partial [Microthrixaceae bacterium]